VDASAGTDEQTQTLDFINIDEITWSGVLVDHMQLRHKIQIITQIKPTAADKQTQQRKYQNFPPFDGSHWLVKVNLAPT